MGPRSYGIAVTRDGRTVAIGVEEEEKVKFFDAKDFTLCTETHVGPMYNDHIVLTPDWQYLLVATSWCPTSGIRAA